MPLEPLETATADYAVLYELACMTTCLGGMNRRRVMIVFSLEERRSVGDARGILWWLLLNILFDVMKDNGMPEKKDWHNSLRLNKSPFLRNDLIH